MREKTEVRKPVYPKDENRKYRGRVANKGKADEFKTNHSRDFPGSPVVKTLHFQHKGCVSVPWSGN